MDNEQQNNNDFTEPTDPQDPNAGGPREPGNAPEEPNEGSGGSLVGIVVLVVLLILAAFFFFSRDGGEAQPEDTPQNGDQPTEETNGTTPEGVETEVEGTVE